MSKNIYYAMAPDSLKSFIQHKNNMQLAASLLTSEKIESIKAEVKNFMTNEIPKNYSAENGTATIQISGLLAPKIDLCSALFGIDMTTYSDIINSIKIAEEDPTIEKIVFEINSPGGSVVGLNRTAEKIKNATKPTTAIITDMAASAAYWLATQANEIIAEHESVEVGSIGVFCECVDSSESEKRNGIEVKAFRSANAPMKNADPFTLEGEKQLVDRITKLESVFLSYVASGRQTSVDNVKENYGKGAMLIAGEALQVGMIDAIESIKLLSTPTQKSNINTKQEVDSMSEKIEMTQEQLDSAIAKAASTAVENALSAKESEANKKVAADKKESERIAGFSGLMAGFPKQAEMIKAEMDKGNFATSDFALSVSAAEKTREKVEAEVKSNEADAAPVVKPSAKTSEENSKLNAVAQMCIKGRI